MTKNKKRELEHALVWSEDRNHAKEIIDYIESLEDRIKELESKIVKKVSKKRQLTTYDRDGY